MGTYPVTVQVSDSASHTSSKSFTLSVTMPSTSLSITTPSTLLAGVVGVAYSTTLSVSGGVGPYTWVVFSGDLPPGLSLDQNAGTITGTPQTAGTFAFTVQVADSTGLDATATFSLTVTATAGTSVSAIEFDTQRLRALADADPAMGYPLSLGLFQVVLARLQQTRSRLLDLYGNPRGR